MTPEKVLEVLDVYEAAFKRSDIGKIQVKFDTRLKGAVQTTLFALMHSHGMIDEMRQFVADGRMDKVFRWLGFIQGVLWTNGWYTLAELMDHNRPPDSTFDASQ